MGFDKDLRDLIQALRKLAGRPLADIKEQACRPIPETVEERVQNMHDGGTSLSPSDKHSDEQPPR